MSQGQLQQHPDYLCTGQIPVRGPGRGRDTKNPHGPTLTISHTAWDHFLNQVATGRTAYGLLPGCFTGGEPLKE